MNDHERESGFTRGDLARTTGCNKAARPAVPTYFIVGELQSDFAVLKDQLVASMQPNNLFGKKPELPAQIAHAAMPT